MEPLDYRHKKRKKWGHGRREENAFQRRTRHLVNLWKRRDAACAARIVEGYDSFEDVALGDEWTLGKVKP